MTCWHCESELVFQFEVADPSKFYHCPKCEKWYEMRKEKERVNGAVPVRFFELENRPAIQGASANA
jgi:hypothetical protein